MQTFRNPKKPPLFPKGFRLILGWVLLVPGFFLFLTPVPVGIFMLTAGFVLLHSASPQFRQRVLQLARRFPGIAQKMRIERILNRMHRVKDTSASSNKETES